MLDPPQAIMYNYFSAEANIETERERVGKRKQGKMYHPISSESTKHVLEIPLSFLIYMLLTCT